MGKKLYYEIFVVGSSKYVVNYHDGKSKHNDGSNFYDIAIFKNKQKKEKFISELKRKGYKKRGYN